MQVLTGGQPWISAMKTDIFRAKYGVASLLTLTTVLFFFAIPAKDLISGALK